MSIPRANRLPFLTPSWPLLGALLCAPVFGDEAPTSKGPPARPVTVERVTAETPRETLRLSGESIPHRRVRLSPEVAGRVERVAVEVGDRVRAGDELLVLDDAVARIEERAARAQRDEARALLKEARRRRDELARLDASRHVSATALESAAAEVEAAEAVAAWREAELARRRVLVERHRLAAPFDGVVVSRPAERGQWAERGVTQLELVAMDTLRVRAPLPQRHYPAVAPGTTAVVEFDALPGRRFEGRVFARLAAGIEATRAFPLLIDLPNPEHALAPGMSARITIELAGPEGEALTVPRDAVVTRADGERVVWRVGDDGRVEPLTVRVGRALGERLEVAGGGLATGDRVVVVGNETLRAGQAVRPVRTPS